MSERLESLYNLALESGLTVSRGDERNLYSRIGDYVSVGPHGPNGHSIKMCAGIHYDTGRLNHWAHSWDKSVGRPISLKFAEEVVKGWAAMKKAGEPV